MNRRQAIQTSVTASFVLLLARTPIVADPILPGFDYFLTPPGGASVDLGLGPISLTGIPLPNFSLGLTDTVVARKDPGPPEGGTGLIDIELVALHLRSVTPVDLDGPGGFPFGDLHITIDNSDNFWTVTTPHPDETGLGPSLFNLPVFPAPPSIGQMSITHGGPGPHTGATMRACLGTPASCDATGPTMGLGLGVPGGGIYATALLVVPGGNPANPSDVLVVMPAPPVTLASMGVYSHTTLNSDQYGGLLLSAITHAGPLQVTQPVADRTLPESLPDDDFNNDGHIDARDYVLWRNNNGSAADYDAWRANFANGVNDCGGCSPVGSGTTGESASIPEPSTLFLLAIGAVSLLGRTRMNTNYRRSIFFAVFAITSISFASPARAIVCTIGPAGNLPPNCIGGGGYLSPNDVHQIIDGLPPGTELLVGVEHIDFFNVTRVPQPGGGEIENFQSALRLYLQGTGALAGYNSFKSMQMTDQVLLSADIDPDPNVKSYDTQYSGQQGQLPPGDPDFDLLRYTAGNAFGLPSPGHTTLTQLPSGNWNVVSYYDMTYRFDFVGRPGGPFGGMSGSTTGTIRMQVGDVPDDDFNDDGHIDARDYVIWRNNNGPAADYDAWRANFANGVNDCGGCSPVGSSTSADSASVPEPSALFLLVIGAVSLLSRRRR